MDLGVMMSEAQDNYENVRRILSFFEYGKATSLRRLSQKTGMTYETLMQLLRPVIQAGLVSRSSDDEEIAYTLRHLEYDSILEQCYGISEPDKDSESADAVRMCSKNTTLVRPCVDAAEDVPSAASQRAQRRRVMASVRESSSAYERVSSDREEAIKSQTGDSERRSSMELQFFDRRRSQQMTAQAVPGRNIPLTGAYNSVSSSSLSGIHKSVYINHISNTHPSASGSRSTYASRSGYGAYGDFHRTDTNFSLKRPGELPQRVTPILSGRAVESSRTEYSEALVRDMIGDEEGLPIYAIDSDKTCFELWSCFSAVSNSGGGIILLGVRRHGISYVIRKNANFDALVSSVLKEFNDRTVISDAPKCRECLDCTDENAGFISKCRDGKKAFIVIRVNRDALSRMHLPIYTKLDSFGSKKDGCYCMNAENEIVRCNDDETKALWERFYLKNEQADWDQTGEMLDTDMSRKLRLEKVEQPEDHTPYLTTRLMHKDEKKPSKDMSDADERRSNLQTAQATGNSEGHDAASDTPEKRKQAVDMPARPISRAFGEESVRHKIASSARRDEEPLLADASGSRAWERTSATGELAVQNALFSATTSADQRAAIARSASHTAESARAAILMAGDIKPYSPGTLAQIRAKVPQLQSELFDIPLSEDQKKAIRAEKTARANAEKLAMNEEMKAQILRQEEERMQEKLKQSIDSDKTNQEDLRQPARRGRKPRVSTTPQDMSAYPSDMPPRYSEDRRAEYDKIAESAIMIPRLNAIRLCAIATKLLRVASLTLPEICDIMKRSQPSIKKNVIQALEHDPHFKSFGAYYYYIDD